MNPAVHHTAVDKIFSQVERITVQQPKTVKCRKFLVVS